MAHAYIITEFGVERLEFRCFQKEVFKESCSRKNNRLFLMASKPGSLALKIGSVG